MQKLCPQIKDFKIKNDYVFSLLQEFQIEDITVSISPHTNALGEGINLFLFPR